MINLKIKEFLSKKQITKLPEGMAKNASVDGSICAASFGASLVGKALSRRNYIKEKKEKRKNRKKKLATNKQLLFLKRLGLNVHKNTSIQKASRMIAQELARTDPRDMNFKLNKQMSMAMDKDD